jgi:thioredoxin reductase (NADPH)
MAEASAIRGEQMFPRLTAAQIGRVSTIGARRQVRAGEALFDLGERHTSFFLVVEGAIEIILPLDGGDHLIRLLGTGGFTGEINILSGRRNLVRGRPAQDGSR